MPGAAGGVLEHRLALGHAAVARPWPVHQVQVDVVEAWRRSQKETKKEKQKETERESACGTVINIVGGERKKEEEEEEEERTGTAGTKTLKGAREALLGGLVAMELPPVLGGHKHVRSLDARTSQRLTHSFLALFP